MEDFFNNKFTLVSALIVLFLLLILTFCLIFGKIPIPRNCWFCNNNNWVPFPWRNSWVCQKCQQYNGFTSDGDYNKPLQLNTNNIFYTQKQRFIPHAHPPSNGLCHKCNTNQELKVMQLANFKPMNDKNYDSEIEQFTTHLENVYKLCYDCKKYVNVKLRKEKGLFLVPRKSPMGNKNKTKFNLSSAINAIRTCMGFVVKMFSVLLLIVIIADIYSNAEIFLSKKMIRIMKQHYKDMESALNNTLTFSNEVKNNFVHYRERITQIQAVNYITSFFPLNIINTHVFKSKILDFVVSNDITSAKLLQTLTLAGSCLQLMLYFSQFGKSVRCLFNLMIWTLSYYVSISGDRYLQIFQIVFGVILLMNSKVSFIQTIDKKNSKLSVSKRMKNLSSSSISSLDFDDQISDNSDMDIGCNRTSTPDYQQNLTNHYSENRSQYTDKLNCSLYSKYDDAPMENTYPRYNPFLVKSLDASQNYLRQRNLHSHASELDESISTLNLGKKNNCRLDRSHIFSTREYNGTSPKMFMCSPTTTVRRPVLSPSRFNHSTQQSWVAGGYWGTESPKQLYNVQDTSRSSSQSSGFESLTSATYKPSNLFPPMREETYANEFSKKTESVFCDRSTYYSGSMRSLGAFQSFPSRCPGVQPSSPPFKPLFVPNQLPNDCSLRLQNLNLLNEFKFLTPSNSFKPLERPMS